LKVGLELDSEITFFDTTWNYSGPQGLVRPVRTRV